jgi:hypothetical protein
MNLPCRISACAISPAQPGDTLYFVVQKGDKPVFATLALTESTNRWDIAKALTAFLRSDSVGAGAAATVDVVLYDDSDKEEHNFTLYGNTAPITDFRMYNSRFGLIMEPVRYAAGTLRMAAILKPQLELAPLDCRIMACPDSLSGPGDTLFFSAEKDGATVSTRYILQEEMGQLSLALTAFVRSTQVGSGLGTCSDIVTSADSYELKGRYTLYGNTGDIKGLRIRNSRIGEILGPLDAPAGTTRLALTFALPSMYQMY